MTYNKVTQGYVVQEFNDQGTCLRQYFVIEEEPSFEMVDSEDNIVEINMSDMPFGGNEYYPLLMEQPS